MNKITCDKKVLAKTLIAVAAAFILFKLFGIFVKPMIPGDYITVFVWGEAFFLVICLIAAAVVGKLSVLKPTFKGFGVGILVALWFLLTGIWAVNVGYAFDRIPETTVPGSEIALFWLGMLLIGLCEELLFRGVLLNGLLDSFGEATPGQIRLGVILAGCVFGLLHITNAMNGVPFTSALIQGICNMPSGILFGAAYIRSRKNLWSTVFVHTLYDACGFVSAGVLAGLPLQSALDSVSWAQLVIGLLELAIALFAMRTKKLQPLVKAQ